MDDNSLKIPKTKVPVTLWVHPDGRVLGSMFINPPSPDQHGEQPADLLNGASDFVVVELDDPGRVRFYNKSAIVRVEYWEAVETVDPMAGGHRPQPCCLNMMDGSVIEGEIWKSAPVERSRLYDYMNDATERFLRLHVGRGEIVLINKSYVVSISPLNQETSASLPRQDTAGSGDPVVLAA